LRLAGLPENVIQYFHCGSQVQLESTARSSLIRLITYALLDL